MALLALQVSNNELTTSFVTQYTVPASKTLRIMEIHLCNTTGAAANVTMCLPESGETADDATPNANAIMKGFDVPPGLPVALAMNTFLNAGDFISAKASVAGVCCIISGLLEDV